jgi:hypothetical protein
MEWLSQNWIWLMLIVGVMMLLSRGRNGGMMGGCCGMAHEGPVEQGKASSVDTPRIPIKGEKAEPAEERSAASQKHGRGGCC